MHAISFRRAQVADAAALGALHVASWRETYDDLLPAEFLATLSPEARGEVWRTVLCDPAAYGEAIVFVAERDGRIVGFGACMKQRDEALKARGFGGEIGAVYVLQSCQRAGAGGALMNLMARALLEAAHSGASLWVLRENVTARAFYERLGGVLIGEKTEEHSGTTLDEVAYGWSDLSRLLS